MWFMTEKTLKMMKAMEALEHNKKAYQKGIEKLKRQTVDTNYKISLAQSALDDFQKSSRKKKNDLKKSKVDMKKKNKKKKKPSQMAGQKTKK